MVARNLRDLPLPDQVEPRVPDMHVMQRVPDQRDRGAGRSHPAQSRMRKAVLPDSLVASLQSLVHCLLGIVAVLVAIKRRHDLYRQMAGFLAAFVAAHAIGHDCQPTFAEKLLIILRLKIAKGILVVLALAADIGLARDFDSGTNFHQSVRGRSGSRDRENPHAGETSDYKG